MRRINRIQLYALALLCSSILFCNKRMDVQPEFETPKEILLITEPIIGYVAADTYIANGYMGKLSYFDGDSIDVYISAKSVIRKARLTIFNASGVAVDYIQCDSIIPQSPTTAKPYEEGFGYRYKIKFKLTTDLKSGIYQIAKKIPFLIKATTRSNQVVVVYPTNTVNAYNKAGGAGSYSSPRAYITSYLGLHLLTNLAVNL